MKDIPGYEGLYAVTTDGRVWSYKNQIFLKPQKRGRGYLCVNLYINGIQRPKTIHRLIGLTYIHNPLNLPQINHIDGVKENNNVNNLEWISNIDNIRHAYSIGLYKPPHGDARHNSVLTESEVKEIRLLRAMKVPLAELSKRFSVHISTISRVATGSRRPHLPL